MPALCRNEHKDTASDGVTGPGRWIGSAGSWFCPKRLKALLTWCSDMNVPVYVAPGRISALIFYAAVGAVEVLWMACGAGGVCWAQEVFREPDSLAHRRW